MTIAICGGGIGGLTAAIALRKLGVPAVVYEQAERYGRVGADINLTPNSVHALEPLGLGAALRETAARPTYRISRTWDTGEETSRLEMADAAQSRYGAPQFTIHRADLLEALYRALPGGVVRTRKQLTGLDRVDDAYRLRFADGSEETASVLVGADGIHSLARTMLFGPENPEFTGVVAYRAVVPTGRLDVPDLDAFTKWWGPDPHTQIVTFPLNRGTDTFVFATMPQSSWRHESWTTPGDVETVRHWYRDFHPQARALLDACDEVLVSALYVRDPLPAWSDGAATLLGDAGHPMMPFMAQGAGMAIEDAVLLARRLHERPDDPAAALKGYESDRLERTSRIQLASRENTWLKDSANADWVYSYDAWSVPLA